MQPTHVNFVPVSSSFTQPSFLTAHQKQDSASVVSIPVSASTHFRAIGDSGPSSPAVQLPGQTSAHSVGDAIKESINATVGLKTEGQGSYMEDFLV